MFFKDGIQDEPESKPHLLTLAVFQLAYLPMTVRRCFYSVCVSLSKQFVRVVACSILFLFYRVFLLF